ISMLACEWRSECRLISGTAYRQAAVTAPGDMCLPSGPANTGLSSGSLPSPHGKPPFLLLASMAPQCFYKTRRQRDSSPTMLRFWLLDPDAVGNCLFERPLDRQLAGIYINVAPA